MLIFQEKYAKHQHYDHNT